MLERILPESSETFVAGIKRLGLDSMSRFAARQMLAIIPCFDALTADASSRKEAAKTINTLLSEAPVQGSLGFGGRGDWETELVHALVQARCPNNDCLHRCCIG